MEEFAAMLPAVLALMGTPGPVTLASAGFGAAWGPSAFRHVAAMTAGTATVMVLVAAGITGLVASIPGAQPVLTALAGAYFLYLAWRIATAPPLASLHAADARPPLLAVYAMAVANPKAFGAMAALFSGFPLLADPVAGAVLKTALLASFALTINTVWMLGGTALAGVMRDPVRSRALNLGFAALLVASVAALFV
jgi:threonine/homoserine/homoserine lactone efflux protein